MLVARQERSTKDVPSPFASSTACSPNGRKISNPSRYSMNSRSTFQERPDSRSDLYGSVHERSVLLRSKGRGTTEVSGKGDKFFFIFLAGASLLVVVTVGAKNGQLPNERQLSGDQLQERPVQRIKCNRPMSTVQHLCPFLLLSFSLSASSPYPFPFLPPLLS